MARIVLNMLEQEWDGRVVETYAHSIKRCIEARGHEVYKGVPGDLSTYDLFLDVDCGLDK